MTTLNKTMNKVDNKLYEIKKILKSYDSSLNVEKLLLDVFENIETNVFEQQRDIMFNIAMKLKDDNLVS